MRRETIQRERRRTPRRRVEGMVDVLGDMPTYGSVIDMSAGGFCASLKEPVWVGEVRLVRVLVMDGTESMRWAEVVWSRPMRPGFDDGEHLVGMRYRAPQRFAGEGRR